MRSLEHVTQRVAVRLSAGPTQITDREPPSHAVVPVKVPVNSVRSTFAMPTIALLPALWPRQNRWRHSHG